MAKNKQWKAIQVDWSTLQNFSNNEADYSYYALTPRQAALCQAWLDFARWRTRWLNLGEPMTNIQKFVAQTSLNLMMENSIMVDCNDVENCLATSPIIIALQNADSNIQIQIDSNDTDILALQNVNTTQSNDILALYAENDIHDSQITQLQLDATQQALTLSDHETRITTLENAGGGGGGASLVKLVAHGSFTPVAKYSTSSGYFVPVDSQNVGVFASLAGGGVTQVRFTFIVRVYGSGLANLAQFRIAHGAGFSFAIPDGFSFPQMARSPDGANWQTLSVIATFEDLPPGDRTFLLEWMISANVVKISADAIDIEIWEIAAPIVSANVVTFDTGGMAYTVANLMSATGIIGVGGNPGNCLKSTNLTISDNVELVIDLGSPKQILDITFDVWRSTLSYFGIKVDGVFINPFRDVLTNEVGVWKGVGYSNFTTPDPLPVGQIVKIVMFGVTPTGDESRIDNILIST